MKSKKPKLSENNLTEKAILIRNICWTLFSIFSMLFFIVLVLLIMFGGGR